MMIRKGLNVLFLIYTYIKANWILLFHYDRSFLKGSKYFVGKRNFTANGWSWVVNDYKMCKIKKVNLDVPWPCSADIRVVGYENIEFHPDDLNNFQTYGNYFQAIGKITIGKGTYIAPNVGIITANHDLNNLDKHVAPKSVRIGERCWIGMNSVILPGVDLGNETIVGAGAVVTKSFPEGHCIIAGNPAKKIREL